MTGSAEQIIRELYAHFNARRLDDAAALFRDDAIVEHAPLKREQRGGAGYLEFARMWLTAFPDASVTPTSVTSIDELRCEVDLLAKGTHEGVLDLAGFGRFKPSGITGELHLRQSIQLAGNRIASSSLWFDVQDIVRQLVAVDVPALLKRLDLIQELRMRLAGIGPDAAAEQRVLLERLGLELDAARHTVRPYFDR